MLGVIIAASGIYMAWVIFAAPRSVSSSKVGLLPEVLSALPKINADDAALRSFDSPNASQLHYKIQSPNEKILIKNVAGYQLDFFKFKSVCRDSIFVQGAIAKRHLPKKTTFAYQGIYYFVISDEKPTIMATNFLNDFFLMVSGECSKEMLAQLVLQKTNIDELLSRPIP